MNGQTNGSSIKQLIQGMSPAGATVLQGTVIEESPLKIQYENDPKLFSDEDNTIVPWQLTDYETEVTVHWWTEDAAGGSGDTAYSAHKHAIEGRKKILVHNSLKKGDKIHVLSFNGGKQYYVLDRVA